MNKLWPCILGLFFVAFASGAAATTCAKDMEGKQSCRSGEMMKCVKRFDANSRDFKYELDGVNANGQVFYINTVLYKKVAVFTPAPCTDSNIAKQWADAQ